MAQQQRQAYCHRCGKYRLHTRQATETHHVLHVLITLFTCGVWLLIWFLDILVTGFDNARKPYLCSVCGEVERPGLQPPQHRMLTQAEAVDVTWQPVAGLPAPQSEQLADHHRRLAVEKTAREKAAKRGHLAEIRRGRRRRLRVAILGPGDERWWIVAMAGAGMLAGLVTYLLVTAMLS